MGKKNRRLKAYMMLMDYNMKTLAEAVGMDKLSLSRKINGDRKFTEPEMMKISKTLECEVTDIFFEDELPIEQQFAVNE